MMAARALLPLIRADAGGIATQCPCQRAAVRAATIQILSLCGSSRVATCTSTARSSSSTKAASTAARAGDQRVAAQEASVSQLADQIVLGRRVGGENAGSGDVAALSRAITIVESSRPEHQKKATELLHAVSERLYQKQQRFVADVNEEVRTARRTLRVGISGAPGVGKSSLIERLGVLALERGSGVGVVAVDPSSRQSGGSILGDKTRMNELASYPSEKCFIRPSPSGRFTLGGITPTTSDAILLLEAHHFQYDLIIVETVGVGQSEVAVDDVVDVVVLVVNPAAGDALQGIKRGIMEIADIVVVNKADGVLLPAAQRAMAEVKAALSLMPRRNKNYKNHDGNSCHRETKVLLCSAEKNSGIDDIYQAIYDIRDSLEEGKGSGNKEYGSGLSLRRREQRQRLLWSSVHDTIMKMVRNHSMAMSKGHELEDLVMRGVLPARAAADELVDEVLKRHLKIDQKGYDRRSNEIT